MIDISLIVCTRNRAHSLARSLEAVSRACALAPAEASIEFVIVDNGSADETASVVERYRLDAGLPVIAVFESRPGLSAARNAGVRAASGSLLAFTDDDCELCDGYFADLLAHFRSDGEPVLRGGRVDLGDENDAPITIKTATEKSRMTPTTIPGGFIFGCNMAMPRRVYDMLGPFDERLGAGAAFCSAEDTDYMLRARWAGVPVEYVPNMSVRHYHGRRTKAHLSKLSRGYEYGNGALLAKHFRSAPILSRIFYWNIKDYLFEFFGKRASSVDDIGITRLRVFCENLRGAFAFAWSGRRSGQYT